MSNDDFDTLNQAQVEQATGLSREVLRKWEIRYLFPQPVRGERGERRYAMVDVRKLTLIKQLIGLGQRPRHLMSSSTKELQGLLQALPASPVAVANNAVAQGLHACLRPGALPEAVDIYLRKLIAEGGLAHFVHHLLPLLNQAVGDAWAAGYLGIHAEHHYTETVRALILQMLAGVPRPAGRSARVLLTTPPGELHGLGLLALQAALTLEGADCVSLGIQTPVADVVQAASEWQVSAVSISASSALQPAAAKSYVLALRRMLPAACSLWVGGQGAVVLAEVAPAGVEVFQTIGAAVEVWKRLKAS